MVTMWAKRILKLLSKKTSIKLVCLQISCSTETSVYTNFCDDKL